MKKIFLIGIIILALLSVSVITLESKFVAGAAAVTIADTTVSQQINIGILNQDPDPAVAGNTFDVRLSVENTGTFSTDNIILEIVPSYPFEEVSGLPLSQNIGSIGAFQSGYDRKIAKYSLKVNKDAVQGSYDLNLRYYVEGQNNIVVTKHVTVNVRGSQSVEIVHIDKTILVPGRESSLKFVITNVGTSPLKDLTFSWSNDAKVILPVGSDNTKYISYLDVGKSVEVEYQVIADTTVNAGLYPLNLVLSYGGSSNKTTLNTVAGIYVGGGTDFDVALSDSTSGTTSFTIANIGSNPATSVSVSIPQQRSWRTTGSSSMIIGNLNKGDYTVASFKLQSQANLGNRTGGRNMTYSNNPTTEGSTNFVNPGDVMIQIAYTDTMGIRTVVNKTINIGTQISGNQTMGANGAYGARGTTAKSNTSKNYTWYIVGAIVLIAGFLVYRRYRKQKILNSDANIKDVFKSKKK